MLYAKFGCMNKTVQLVYTDKNRHVYNDDDSQGTYLDHLSSFKHLTYRGGLQFVLASTILWKIYWQKKNCILFFISCWGQNYIWQIPFTNEFDLLIWAFMCSLPNGDVSSLCSTNNIVWIQGMSDKDNNILRTI